MHIFANPVTYTYYAIQPIPKIFITKGIDRLGPSLASQTALFSFRYIRMGKRFGTLTVKILCSFFPSQYKKEKSGLIKAIIILDHYKLRSI